MSPLIFEKSRCGRVAKTQMVQASAVKLPQNLARQSKPLLPEVSELQVVRHFTQLSQKNFSVDTHFYPLGSCTMKYNPQIMHQLASLPSFLNLHPLTDPQNAQGTLKTLFELQEMLKAITGMQAASLSPMAGSQGELAGALMIKAYHDFHHDEKRIELLVPDAAHGTNPATAAMAGFEVKSIKTTADGDLDIEDLKAHLSDQTAGIMLTNPSTLGVFERQIELIAELVHGAGGLLYYDGANLNAILGRVKPFGMGFDIVHLNLHKTFGTPHGGGGPGAGPVLVNEKLKPFLPYPFVVFEDDHYRLIEKEALPYSIGPLSAFYGNVGILLRAYVYLRLIGQEGLKEIAGMAVLNANYLMVRLMEAGFEVAFPERRASHEFIVSLEKDKKAHNVTAKDYGKRLLDYGVHAPTTYFPLLVPECFLIEPTETETLEDLDRFVDIMIKIREEVQQNPDMVLNAPHTMPVKRLDEVRAAREMNLVYKESK